MAPVLLRRSVTFALSLFLLAGATSGQELADRLLQEWRWRELSLPLGEEKVRSLTVDPQGRLVVLTTKSVLRYDGAWEVVPGSEHVRPGTGAVVPVLAARGGLLLSPDAGAHVWLDEDGRADDGALPRGEPWRAAAHLGDGTVLIAVGSEYLRFADGRALSSVPCPPEHGRLLGARSGTDGNLYVCVVGGIACWTGTAWRSFEIPAQVRPDAFYRDIVELEGRLLIVPHPRSMPAPMLELLGDQLVVRDQERYWVGAAAVPGEGLVVADRDRDLTVWGQPDPYHDGIRPRSLAYSSRGHLVVVDTRGRVWICDLASRTWECHRPGSSPTENTVHALARSRRGGLWVATNVGLARWNGERFTDRHRQALATPLHALTAVREDEGGDVWVGSGSHFDGVFCLSGDRWQRIREPFAGHAVHSIERTPDGALWFFLLGPPGRALATDGGGVVRFDGATWTRYTTADGLPSNRCYDLAISPDGNPLVGTYSGVAVLDGEVWRPLPGVEQSGMPLPARVVHVDREGTLWIACGIDMDGLFRWRDGALLAQTDRLTAMMVGDVVNADEGGIWISSRDGLFRHDAFGLHEATVGDHVPERRFWPALADQEGTLWLGSLGNGLIRYRPASGAAPPTIVDLSATRDDAETGSVTWRAHHAWGATQPENLRYLWNLDGGPWRGPTAATEHPLGQLAVGEHVIEVCALDPSGRPGPLARTTLVVPPPVLSQPLVLIPVSLGLIGLVLLSTMAFRQRRMRRAVERDERRRLEVSESHFRNLVERAHVLFASIESDGRFVYASPTFRAFLGGELADDDSCLLGLVMDDSIDAVRSLRRARAAPFPATCSVELHLETSDGERWLHLIQSPRSDGSRCGFDLVGLDVTERRQIEREREEVAGVLRQTQKMEAVGRLAAGVAHDFNNTLTVIAGHAEFVGGYLSRGEEPTDEEVLDSTEKIKRAARRAAVLTGQLLAFGRQDALRPRCLDLAQALSEVSDMLRPLVRENIDLALNADADVPAIRLDPMQLQQVVMNLVINAGDAMPDGGSLRVEARRFSSARADSSIDPPLAPGEYAVLSVVDTGQGIEPDACERIFEPFFSTKEMGKGTGLGLATVRDIAVRCDGGVRVTSESGRGSTFEVFFPSVIDAEPTAALSVPAPDSSGSEILLVCEDDEEVLDFAVRTLESRGYSVHGVATPVAGLDRAAELPELDLLLSDVILPGRNGWQLANEVRRVHPDLRVLFMSGYAPDTALPEGDVDLLSKPFDADELARRVRAALDGPPSLGEAGRRRGVG